jgi:hypothetical protein
MQSWSARWPWRLDLADGYDAEMRFRLRTLMIAVMVLPPLLAGIYWAAKEYQRRQDVAALVKLIDWKQQSSP